MATHSTRSADAPPRDLPEVATLRADQRERRQRVVDAARRLMVQVEYPKIQIKDVAVEADVALGTLYRYFSSKDHLFACALIDWASGFGDRLEYGRHATPLDRVKSVYRRAARAFEREPLVYDVLIHLQSTRDEQAAGIYQQFAREQQAAFLAALGDLDSPDADGIIEVMGAVLSEGLRSQQAGLATFAQVQARIARAADLLLR